MYSYLVVVSMLHNRLHDDVHIRGILELIYQISHYIFNRLFKCPDYVID